LIRRNVTWATATLVPISFVVALLFAGPQCQFRVGPATDQSHRPGAGPDRLLPRQPARIPAPWHPEGLSQRCTPKAGSYRPAACLVFRLPGHPAGAMALLAHFWLRIYRRHPPGLPGGSNSGCYWPWSSCNNPSSAGSASPGAGWPCRRRSINAPGAQQVRNAQSPGAIHPVVGAAPGTGQPGRADPAPDQCRHLRLRPPGPLGHLVGRGARLHPAAGHCPLDLHGHGGWRGEAQELLPGQRSLHPGDHLPGDDRRAQPAGTDRNPPPGPLRGLRPAPVTPSRP
jgi:hypothetical protein